MESATDLEPSQVLVTTWMDHQRIYKEGEKRELAAIECSNVKEMKGFY